MKIIYFSFFLIFFTSTLGLRSKIKLSDVFKTTECKLESIYYTYEHVYSDPFLNTVVIPTSVVTVQPAYYYPYVIYLAKIGGKDIKFSVISDKDSENFEVKGKLLKNKKERKESWYVHYVSETSTEVEEGVKICEKLHLSYRENKFSEKKSESILPSTLIPKESNFKTPEINSSNKIKDKTDTNIINVQTYPIGTKEENKIEKVNKKANIKPKDLGPLPLTRKEGSTEKENDLNEDKKNSEGKKPENSAPSTATSTPKEKISPNVVPVKRTFMESKIKNNSNTLEKEKENSVKNETVESSTDGGKLNLNLNELPREKKIMIGGRREGLSSN